MNRTPDDRPAPDLQAADLSRAADTWGERAADIVANRQLPAVWADSPVVQRTYIHPLTSDDPNENWLGGVARDYFQTPADLSLTLGSGAGGLERHGASVNLARRFHGYDVSEGAVQAARQEAEAFGGTDRIEYFVADLNRLEFAPERYDVVFGSQALHHIRALEHVYDQIERTLKPGGLFVFCEFVGANQFQWPEAQMAEAQRMLESIPERLRVSVRDGSLITRVVRQPLDVMNAIDPTEAIRSEDILPLTEERFEIIRRRDFGGTFLHLVLENIAVNFTDSAEDLAVLERLCAAEQELLRSGRFESDFTVVVARPKA